MDGMAGMGVWMLIWGLLGLALIALVVVGVVWLVRSMSSSRPVVARRPPSCWTGRALGPGL